MAIVYVPGDFATIQAALDSGASDVSVAPGTYNETLTFTKDAQRVVPDGWFKLPWTQGQVPTKTGYPIKLDGNGKTGPGVYSTFDQTLLAGCLVVNVPAGEHGIHMTGDTCSVFRCMVDTPDGDGILLPGNSPSVLLSVAKNPGGRGVVLGSVSSTSPGVAESCLAFGAGGVGIEAYTPYNYVYGSVAYDCTGDYGIKADDCRASIALNNTVVIAGIRAVTEVGNCSYGHVGTHGNFYAAKHATSLEQDPDFQTASVFNFRLDAGSPCINATVPIPTGLFSHSYFTKYVRLEIDLDGRVWGTTRRAMGAYEYYSYGVVGSPVDPITTGQGFILNTLGWDGAEVSIQVGANKENWDYDTQVGTTTSNPKAVIESITGWANDSGRAWAGTATFTASLVFFEDGRTGIQIECDTVSSYEFLPNSILTTKLKTPEWATDESFASLYGIPGTLSENWALRNWSRRLLEDGGRASSGSWFMDSQKHSRHRPSLEAVLTEGEVASLQVGLEDSGSPRTALVWDTITSQWRTVHLGSVDVTRGELQLYRVKASVQGVE